MYHLILDFPRAHTYTYKHQEEMTNSTIRNKWQKKEDQKQIIQKMKKKVKVVTTMVRKKSHHIRIIM